ncbi:cyclase [Sphingomonas sp. DBB INV C78]|uniref:MBL fold metallo-hydrolase n=1 Tax=Sphingomonas sp. DBB INV C78 TaxID=3349434 RepID=UPI0036D402D0
MRFIVTGLTLLMSTAVAAQPVDPAKVNIRSVTLAPGVAVLFGAGGNIGVSHGADGTVLIDDQFAPLTDKINQAVNGLGAKPVRFVINTHWHGDHTGGNENLGKAGAVIVAHDNVRARMSTEQFMKQFNERVPASPAGALPVVTFAEGVALHLNGDTLSVVHVEHAHTDGDALVKWQKANVLHGGDVFVRYGLPFIDVGSGGSIQGMIAGVDKAIAMADANTKVIPGHGEMATRDDMIAYRDMLKTIMDRVAAGRKAGQTLAQIQASKPTREWPAKPGDFIKPDDFVATVYANLAEPPSRDGDHKH